MMYLILFLFQVIFLFFISRQTTNQIFLSLRNFIKNERIVFSLVSLIYLPGTILHEIGHLFAAMILFLKVKEINIFPEFEENYIKLGSVLYEKKDFVRSFFVGIAPFFAGILSFYFISVFNLFPSANLLLNLLLAYIIFSISSTMFSSKQDLIDFIFMIPFSIFVAGFIYIFQINLNFIFENKNVINNLLKFLKEINFYLFISLIINLGSIIILKLVTAIVKNDFFIQNHRKNR